jgi:hypothetical protein
MNHSTILSITSLLFAAFFKAVADTSADHFDSSVFKWWDRRFWDKTTASQYAPFLKFTTFRMDAWHIANSLMIWCFIACPCFLVPVKWYYKLAVFVLAGIAYVISFNLSYNKILRKK